MLVFVVAACETGNGRKTVPVDPKTIDMPDWVKSGYHANYNSRNGYVFVMLSGAAEAPSRFVVQQTLYRQIHGAYQSEMAKKLESPLKEASLQGRWVSRLHVPEDKIVFEQWSDGFESASFAAIERSALKEHNGIRLGLGLKHLTQNLREPDHFDTALADLRSRAERAEKMLDELMTIALAGEDISPYQSKANAAANRLIAFDDEVRVNISGGDLRLMLGTKPKTALEFECIYRGKPAVNLPLAPIEAGQKIETVRQTDDRGMARIIFPDAVRYNGRAESAIGYELNPDLLLASIETGIAMKPWTTKLELPARGNVVLYLNLTEKYENGAITDGPVRSALREMLKLSGVEMIEEQPAKTETRFVLTIEGVLACTELKDNRQGVPRQTRAKGALVFKSWPVPALSSVTFDGIADIRDGNLEQASRDALENGWALCRETLVTKYREAFPPLFLLDDGKSGN